LELSLLQKVEAEEMENPMNKPRFASHPRIACYALLFSLSWSCLCVLALLVW
jgi:hypothetical protein